MRELLEANAVIGIRRQTFFGAGCPLLTWVFDANRLGIVLRFAIGYAVADRANGEDHRKSFSWPPLLSIVSWLDS
jgi:hypothetical protein